MKDRKKLNFNAKNQTYDFRAWDDEFLQMSLIVWGIIVAWNLFDIKIFANFIIFITRHGSDMYDKNAKLIIINWSWDKINQEN